MLLSSIRVSWTRIIRTFCLLPQISFSMIVSNFNSHICWSCNLLDQESKTYKWHILQVNTKCCVLANVCHCHFSSNSFHPSIDFKNLLNYKTINGSWVFSRVNIIHTSQDNESWIYSPKVNYALMILCLPSVVGFSGGKQIGNAFGRYLFLCFFLSETNVPYISLVHKTKILYTILHCQQN